MNSTAAQMIQAKLEALPKMHTSVIAGKPVTRWSELYEIGTYAITDNLYDFNETLKRLVG